MMVTVRAETGRDVAAVRSVLNEERSSPPSLALRIASGHLVLRNQQLSADQVPSRPLGYLSPQKEPGATETPPDQLGLHAVVCDLYAGRVKRPGFTPSTGERWVLAPPRPTPDSEWIHLQRVLS